MKVFELDKQLVDRESLFSVDNISPKEIVKYLNKTLNVACEET